MHPLFLKRTEECIGALAAHKHLLTTDNSITTPTVTEHQSISMPRDRDRSLLAGPLLQVRGRD